MSISKDPATQPVPPADAAAQLVYAGDIGPREAWQMLSDNETAVLVDVRTAAEWQYVGLPDLRALGKDPVLVNWQVFPGMTVHTEFVAEITAKGLNPGQPLLFLCRSGVRSRHAAAAMTTAGFAHCYNIAEGFEGDKDDNAHRGQTGGWKVHGLPWVQG